MRRSIEADSMAVLIVCCLTATGSQTPSSFMSAMTPFSVITRSGFIAMMSAHTSLMAFSSSSSRTSHAFSSESSICVCDSPFLYSSVQSSSRMRGFSIRRRIFEWTTSLLIITPLSTRQSSMSPPGIFSVFAYRLMSISLRPASSIATQLTASSASPTSRSESFDTNLVPVQLSTSCAIFFLSLRSRGTASSSSHLTASSRALRYPLQMIVGWMCRSRSASDFARYSPASTMTDVVPSPTSSSCARESSIMDLAAGCDTSTSRRIEFPSLVITMPPIGSRIILSIERGPSVERMMSETALPAAMLESCALRPVSR
ncbi:t-complex protein 1 subunit alpha [Chrysochromulina tobinii]|uniref:T-complex protein 1 subunit alpha n=1 Tax=Chrysochromulina tobinii TaxID=1460289 RepID=A0A0M0JM95_9EUKA|nr:t-complex protein 1 subunit alpha [Chrysochromulina tobinii]|eukprot:KOO27437.1 t-complex protein 1 subunit alpha [Chrysochromulina sp. CCMP291]